VPRRKDLKLIAGIVGRIRARLRLLADRNDIKNNMVQ